MAGRIRVNVASRGEAGGLTFAAAATVSEIRFNRHSRRGAPSSKIALGQNESEQRGKRDDNGYKVERHFPLALRVSFAWLLDLAFLSLPPDHSPLFRGAAIDRARRDANLRLSMVRPSRPTKLPANLPEVRGRSARLGACWPPRRPP